MRILLALYFMFTQAIAQVAPPTVFPAAPNYVLPSMQSNSPWSYRAPIYGSGLPAFYPLRPPSMLAAPVYAPGYATGYAPNYALGPYGQQPYAFGLGGPMLPPPPQQNSLAPLLALGLPLFAQMFGAPTSGGGLSLNGGASSPVTSIDDCETCRGLRSSPVLRRFGPPLTPPSDLRAEAPGATEAAVPMTPIAAAVPAYQPAVLPTAAVVRSSSPAVDRIATVDETPAPAPVTAAPTPAARVFPKPTATTVVRGTGTPGITTTRERATPAELLVVRARTRDEQRSQGAPVWNTFLHNFKICAPGCQPADYGTFGSRGNNSCHPSGRAIDIHKMVCGGRVFTAIANQPEFRSMVACMGSAPGNRTKSQRPVAPVRGLLPMRTLYQNKDPRRYGVTQAHYDHAHFSITCFNGRVW